MAARDGNFIAVRPRAKVEAAVGDDARVDTTLADKFVIADFVEQHVHPLLAALTTNTKVISIEDRDAIDGFSPAVRDQKTYQARLTKAMREHKGKSAPFITWGYHHHFHGDLSPKLLDKLAPESSNREDRQWVGELER